MKHDIKPIIGIMLGLGAAGISMTILAGHSRAKPVPRLAVMKAEPNVKADPGVRRIAAADTDFGFRLLVQLAPAKPAQNVVFSPFSISQALDLTLNGAGGKTRQDIAATLGIGTMTTETVNQANSLLLPSLKNPDPKVEMTVANALWIPQGHAFNPDFQARCRQFYGVETTALDLSGPSGERAINGWVRRQTRGKITEIVSSADLATASAVLTNAVYFHALWTRPFDTGDTHPDWFLLSDGSRKPVSLMTQEGRLTYLKTKDFQAVRLPYGQGCLAMYVFLPTTASNLDGFLRTATQPHWSAWLARMQPTQMTLYLPRFHADDQRTLNEPLSQMGMANAFGPAADFAPMGLADSSILKVVHKATLDVSEKGTVATAATAVLLGQSALVAPKVEMRVDHPFFCAIRDDATETMLFLGAIRSPN